MKNSVKSFLEECVKAEYGEFVSKERLYHEYSSFTKINSLNCENKENFGRILKKLNYADDRISESGRRFSVWKDIKLLKR